MLQSEEVAVRKKEDQPGSSQEIPIHATTEGLPDTATAEAILTPEDRVSHAASEATHNIGARAEDVGNLLASSLNFDNDPDLRSAAKEAEEALKSIKEDFNNGLATIVSQPEAEPISQTAHVSQTPETSELDKLVEELSKSEQPRPISEAVPQTESQPESQTEPQPESTVGHLPEQQAETSYTPDTSGGLVEFAKSVDAQAEPIEKSIKTINEEIDEKLAQRAREKQTVMETPRERTFWPKFMHGFLDRRAIEKASKTINSLKIERSRTEEELKTLADKLSGIKDEAQKVALEKRINDKRKSYELLDSQLKTHELYRSKVIENVLRANEERLAPLKEEVRILDEDIARSQSVIEGYYQYIGEVKKQRADYEKTDPFALATFDKEIRSAEASILKEKGKVREALSKAFKLKSDILPLEIESKKLAGLMNGEKVEETAVSNSNAEVSSEVNPEPEGTPVVARSGEEIQVGDETGENIESEEPIEGVKFEAPARRRPPDVEVPTKPEPVNQEAPKAVPSAEPVKTEPEIPPANSETGEIRQENPAPVASQESVKEKPTPVLSSQPQPAPAETAPEGEMKPEPAPETNQPEVKAEQPPVDQLEKKRKVREEVRKKRMKKARLLRGKKNRRQREAKKLIGEALGRGMHKGARKKLEKALEELENKKK